MRLTKPVFVDASETSITIQCPNEPSCTIQYKEYSAASWNTFKIKGTTTEVYDLEPGTTYCVRLFDGTDSGPELVVDTEQVGCTPKADKSCCIVS